MASVPQVLRHHAAEIDDALARAYDRLLPRVEALHPSLGDVTRRLRAYSDGGKRIRPALLLLGFEAAGGGDRAAVHGPALSLELLHTCALLHDDVIDRADLRRGRPTLHRDAAERHTAAGWHGDPTAYGEAVAILLGDLAFVHADELFLDARVPERSLLAAFRRFVLLREEVMVGQYLDLQAATTRTADRDLALTIATLKSGRYSVARPLQIGAMLAGAAAELVETLGAFGDPLGRAFQLRDDLLGVFGAEASTGKSASSDLIEGKRTVLVAEGLDRLDPTDAATLEGLLGDPALDAAGAETARSLLRVSGAVDAVEREIARSVATSVAVLDELTLHEPAGRSLREVADYLGDRSA